MKRGSERERDRETRVRKRENLGGKGKMKKALAIFEEGAEATLGPD